MFNDYLYRYQSSSNGELPLNEEEYANAENIWYIHPTTNQTLMKYEWKEMSAWDIDAPQCFQTRTTKPSSWNSR